MIAKPPALSPVRTIVPGNAQHNVQIHVCGTVLINVQGIVPDHVLTGVQIPVPVPVLPGVWTPAPWTAPAHVRKTAPSLVASDAETVAD